MNDEARAAEEAQPDEVPFWAHLAPFAAWAFLLHVLGDPAPWKHVAAVGAAIGLAFHLRPWRDMPTWSHVAPFAAWIAVMAGLGDPPAAWKYAVRAALGLALLLGTRPWRGYPAPRLRHVPLAVGVGLFVFVLWVFPESPWVAERAPGLHRFYVRFLVGLWPFGRMPEPLTEFPYAPEACGWALTLVRLAGSAFVIATIEEFFWRSFLYRWMLGPKFMEVDPGRFDGQVLLMVSAVFAVAHEQWFAGLLAGLIYGMLYIRTRDIWAAVIAHVVTNLVLGLYVLHTGLYHFW